MHNHKHFIATGYVRSAPGPQMIETVEQWFRSLVSAIEMNILIEPKVVYCDTEDNEGLTGIVCIETSHSSIHFWAKPQPFFKFDLYSCMDFQESVVVDKLKEFGLTKIEWTTIDRNKDYNPTVASGGANFREECNV